jgi:Ca2+-binding EF-hand superfamily protein
MPLPGFTPPGLPAGPHRADNSCSQTLRLAKDFIMVASISSNTGSVSNWADSVFSKLDTKNQGYIEKSDLQSALSATGDSGSTQSGDIDDAFNALDGDGDGKVTKSELTDAMTKLSDQLNAQFDASRMNGGGGVRHDGSPPGPPPGQDSQDGSSVDAASGTSGTQGTQGAGGPHGAHGHHGGGGAMGSTDSAASTSSTTEAADTNGDGTVSAEELAAYETKQASATTASSDSGSSSSTSSDGTGTSSSSSTQKAHHELDPMREFAHALQLLKAYADNGSASTSSTTSATSTGSISVEA